MFKKFCKKLSSAYIDNKHNHINKPGYIYIYIIYEFFDFWTGTNATFKQNDVVEIGDANQIG